MSWLGKILSDRNIRNLGYAISSLGFVILVRLIYLFFELPSTSEVPETIELFFYKEQTFTFGYLTILMITFGIALIYRAKIGWIVPQSFIIIWTWPFIYLPVAYGILSRAFVFYILGFFYFLIAYLIFMLFRKEKLVEFFKIERSQFLKYYIITGVLACGYWIINTIRI